MSYTIADAASYLAGNVRAKVIELETLAEIAYSLGDEQTAGVLAQQSTDLTFVSPQIEKLPALPDIEGKDLPWSNNPNVEERGMRLVYLEALKMLKSTRSWLDVTFDAEKREVIQNQLAIERALVRRVLTQCHLAVC